MLNIFGLNEAQREAVMHGEGPALVIAGPGSGKTLVITNRIRYLIENMGVSPEKILVITFTKDAAVSMQQRFQRENISYLPVQFGTFHSIFYHILRDALHNKQFNILTLQQKQHLLLPILRQFPMEQNPYDARELMREESISILSAISYLKNTEDKQTAISYLSEEWQPFFDVIFEKYEDARKKENAIDFDDMVYECKRILQGNHSVRERWQQYFSYILIDEFQDINPMQYEVIKLLSKEPYNIFAVGDDDQSIYGFRGARPDCLQRLCEDYPVKQMHLNINYRSCEDIVKCSLSVINENKNRFVKELEAYSKTINTDDNKVICKSFKERNEQYQQLCKEIREYEKQNPNTTYAVLFRTNAYMQSVAALLKRESVPFQMREHAPSVYEHMIVKDIMAYMELANEGLKRSLFLRIMNKPIRYISRNALGGSELSFTKIQEYYLQYGDKKYIADILIALEQLQQQLQHLKGKPPFLAVQYIRKVIRYEQYLREGKSANQDVYQDNMDMLDWITEDAKKYSTYKEWCVAQKEFALMEKEKICKEGVQLMTVHAAKGLEFEHVWIVDCNEKIFPHGSMLTEEQIEEERRIFYVAMTRAKKTLELFYLIGTEEQPKIVSRFMNPILEK